MALFQQADDPEIMTSTSHYLFFSNSVHFFRSVISINLSSRNFSAFHPSEMFYRPPMTRINQASVLLNSAIYSSCH